uniref:Retrovirus-related Pol polyprotein from transposon TNT 1-94 n=1 Tax=Tanacetum cinerariifolium TaxID=118510 RepID=A0A6L2NKC7_TANCI|nr:retrovirus-related Pol polyprotein from transposon TNT 1-94 [Tanacetum cinerariifolium]
MAFVSTPSTDNNDNVSTVFGVITASPQVSTANLSDATVYAFLAKQPNGSQLVHEDLEQIHKDDLEEIDLKWQLALLSMKANRTMNVEDTSSKAMVTINGAGFDWSYMADDEAPTNMAFMAFSDSEDDIEIKIKKFENASQRLDKLIGSQITNKSKRGLGYVSYNAIPPPHTGKFLPPRIDLSYIGLPEFVEPSVESYEVKPIKVVTQTSSVKISKPVKENNDAPLIEDWKSEGEDEVVSSPEIERKTVEPSVDKARCKYHQRERMVNGTNRLRVNHSANTVPKAVLTRTGLKHVNTVRPVNLKSTRRGYIAFGGGAIGGKITGKGIMITARTPQQNEVAERRNRTLIKAARTMLADSKLPTTFWAEAVNTACYVQNRVLVVKPYFKTPYELFRGRTRALSFMKPFGCHVTILNTLYHLGMFDGKSDEEFFVGYSTNSKAFRVYNTRTRKVEENLHINFFENKPIIAGTNSNDFAGKGASFDAGEIDNQERPNAKNNTKDVNTAGPSINTVSSNINTASPTVNTVRLSDDFFGADNDMRSLDGVESGVQTRRMTVITNEQGFISAIYDEKTHEDLHTLRIEAIRLFLAYASFMDFFVYQMDVNSTFLYERIEEEVYVCQPPGFEDPHYPNKVNKVEKALYGLHQALRACGRKYRVLLHSTTVIIIENDS